MKRKSATTKSAAAHRLGRPLSDDCGTAFSEARMDAVLIPPNPAMTTSRRGEPCISRRTSWKNDIIGMRPVVNQLRAERAKQDCKLLPLRSRQHSIVLRAPLPFDTARGAGE